MTERSHGGRPETMTADEARRMFRYAPASGLLYWISYPIKYGRARVGDIAGTLDANNQWIVTFGRKRYKAHRIVWLLHHGFWPSDEIDHINGDTADNRIANLREATHAQNLRNTKKRSDNTSGFKGVCAAKGGKWRATIRVAGRYAHLGTFATPQDAHAAYRDAASLYYGEFARAA